MPDQQRMKAAVFYEHGGPEVLRYEDIAVPEPGPGEIRVRVGACALNAQEMVGDLARHGGDVRTRDGRRELGHG
jgi:NADPH:quinone reductase-like Zn-dependent oxidoreductase